MQMQCSYGCNTAYFHNATLNENETRTVIHKEVKLHDLTLGTQTQSEICDSCVFIGLIGNICYIFPPYCYISSRSSKKEEWAESQAICDMTLISVVIF